MCCNGAGKKADSEEEVAEEEQGEVEEEEGQPEPLKPARKPAAKDKGKGTTRSNSDAADKGAAPAAKVCGACLPGRGCPGGLVAALAYCKTLGP